MDQLKLETVIDSVDFLLAQIFDEASSEQIFSVYVYLRDSSDTFLKKYINQ